MLLLLERTRMMNQHSWLSAYLSAIICLASFILAAPDLQSAERWTPDRAQQWYQQQPWLVGCNYLPSSAINQLEMWQPETFDPETIDRELGWARSLGFTSVRVFLHDLMWQKEGDAFLQRIDQFLGIADKHQIGVMLVIFDGVWDPNPQLGPQRAPKPGVHNSGWVQSPGKAILSDPQAQDGLEAYITAVVRRFGQDRRVQVWDLFNEPDNANANSYGAIELPPDTKDARAAELVRKVFGWARAAEPQQPLTVGVWVGHEWDKPETLNQTHQAALELSDVISFHDYGDPNSMNKRIEALRRYDRPLLCTEFMARGNGSTFEAILPILKEQQVGAYCWGLVDGKSQTKQPWSTWQTPILGEPDPWHHDIFRQDGTAYSESEVKLIRELTTPAAAPEKNESPAGAAIPFEDPEWRYTFDKPSDGWMKSDFDDSAWQVGPGGFGTRGTPGARVGTTWNTNDIWMRRSVSLPSVLSEPALYLYHDEDAEIYINGQLVASPKRWVTEFVVIPLDQNARAAVQAGENLIAVHCHQADGGQGIDVHLIDAKHVPKLPLPPRSTVPFKSELLTKWGEQLTADSAWQEYPRPGMTRDQWTNLNGHWDYCVTPRDQQTVPDQWTGKILVPFCLESRLSGVQRLLNPDESLWYHTEFELEPKADTRTLLHFEAVDYRCDVFVNGQPVGSHQGGNTPFAFDIATALKSGINQLVVRVDDDTEAAQLRGKQVLFPQGIFYTQVTGIWQTVWLEQVPNKHIADLKIETDAKAGSIKVTPQLSAATTGNERYRLTISDGDRQLVSAVSPASSLTIKLDNPKLWTPEQPHLYSLKFAILDSHNQVIDEVGSYAGIRSVGKVRDAQGHLRFTLNDKVVFHWGPLDQGWWPDGLLTPPSDEAMRSDIEFLKAAGFNMIRKHIKVEPRRYYYHCDRLGMLVWQDQVSGGNSPPWTRLAPDPVDAQWSAENHKQFMYEFDQMIHSLQNHPSIVVWTPFNEAWGQHDTIEVGKWTSQRDPSRLVNVASGGNFWPIGDVVDEHSYPHPAFPFDPSRYHDFIKVVGEFGGHGLPVEGHLWDNQANNWGYGGLPKNAEENKQRYIESIRRLTELKQQGIAAGVYTQTTDVEGEINGLMTYDRKVIKIPAEELRAIHKPLLD